MKLKEKASYGAVAAAVAIACSSPWVADAATLSVGSTLSMSQQGNALVTATSLTNFTVLVSLARDYVQNDTAQISLSGGTFPTAGTLGNALCSAGTTTSTMGALSYAAGSANFRATSTPSPAAGQVCTFNLSVLTNSMQTSTVQVGYAAQTASSNVSFDAGTAITIGTVADQFASSVAGALNGVVNVNNNRLHFAADDGAGLTGNDDALTVSIGNSSALANGATLTSVAISIVGNFSFLDDDGTAGCTASDISAGAGRAFVASGALAIDAGCTTLTYTEANPASGTRVIVLGKSNTASAGASTNEKTIEAPQTFAGSVRFSYAGVGTAPLATTRTDTIAPGAFTLNGFSVPVSFMPYGTGRSRILWITNRSAQAGAVSFAAVNDAGVACAASNFPAVTAIANGVTQLAGQLDAGIAACYGASFAGRVAFTVTANIPSATTELFSGYNNNGDVAVVVNQSNGYSATPRP